MGWGVGGVGRWGLGAVRWELGGRWEVRWEGVGRGGGSVGVGGRGREWWEVWGGGGGGGVGVGACAAMPRYGAACVRYYRFGMRCVAVCDICIVETALLIHPINKLLLSVEKTRGDDRALRQGRAGV